MSGVQLEIDVECLAVSRGLVEVSTATGKPIGVLIRQNSRLIAVNLAFQTQPLGDGESARAQGQDAVRRDIGVIYQTPQEAYTELLAIKGKGKQSGKQVARAFYSAVMTGKLDRAKKILRSVGVYRDLGKFDGGAYHERARNSRGRISRTRASQIVTDPKRLKPYMRKIERRVGIAKSGWADVARELGGTRGIPQWVKRHKLQSGTVTDQTTDPDEPYIIMRNNVPWIRKVLTERQQIDAMRMQRQKMLISIRHTLDAIARKAGLPVG